MSLAVLTLLRHLHPLNTGTKLKSCSWLSSTQQRFECTNVGLFHAVSFIPSFSAVPNNELVHNGNNQVRFRSNRSRRGLYDGKDVRTGNNVPFSMKKTKRRYLPNVFKKRVYSDILDEMIPFHLTTSALRSIDKAGGLDNYLLSSKHVTEGEGMRVKQRIQQKIESCKKKGIDVLPKIILQSSRSEQLSSLIESKGEQQVSS